MSIGKLNVLSTVLLFGLASNVFAQGTPSPGTTTPGTPSQGTTAQGAALTTTNPTYELSAGYQFVHVPDQTFPFGLAIDGAWHSGRFGMAAEAGWARHSDDDNGGDASTNMFHIAAGPRWSGFGSGRWWPYVQVLAGAAIARSSVEIAGIDSSDTETAFMVQPGVGVTFVAGDGWGMFGQVDYRRTFFDEPEDTEDSVNNQFRIFLGFRMILD
jgi:Outer membrane protein beta-barrel domain